MRNRLLKKFVVSMIVFNLFLTNFAAIGNTWLQSGISHALYGQVVTTINQDVQAYRKVQVGGEDKLVVQLKVENIIEIQDYDSVTITNTNLEIVSPIIKNKKPETVKIIPKRIELSNKDISQFSQEDWRYTGITGKVKINMESEKVVTQSKQDEFLINFIYDNEVADLVGENENIEINCDIQAENWMNIDENFQSVGRSNNRQFNLREEFGNLSTYSAENVDIYKGYMYANYNLETQNLETDFTEKNKIEIYYSEIFENIEIHDTGSYFLDEFQNEFGVVLKNKRVQIKKSNFDKILGQEGYIKIIDENGNQIEEILAQTVQEEFLKVDLNHLGNINVKTSKPVTEGLLEIEIIKSIQPNLNYTRAQVEIFNNLELNKKCITSYGEINYPITNTLKESSTNAVLEMQEDSFSTIIENKNVDLKILLNNTSEQSDLYVNPTFELEFPQQITNMSVKNINGLFDNQIEIKSSSLTKVNNKYVLKIITEGSQTRFDMGSITEGMNIVINVDFKTGIDTPTSEEQIVMKYINENVVEYKESIVENEVIKGVASKNVEFEAPHGIVNINTIENYNGEGSILQGVNHGELTGELAIGQEGKVATNKIQVLNNYDYACDKISVLGRVPSKDNNIITDNTELQSNITFPMKNGITTSEDVTIYYSTNLEATEDLTIADNNWVTEVNDFSRDKIIFNSG